jgi:hypothetical protein
VSVVDSLRVLLPAVVVESLRVLPPVDPAATGVLINPRELAPVVFIRFWNTICDASSTAVVCCSTCRGTCALTHTAEVSAPQKAYVNVAQRRYDEIGAVGNNGPAQCRRLAAATEAAAADKKYNHKTYVLHRINGDISRAPTATRGLAPTAAIIPVVP